MSDLIRIDGAQGEGGGQILRTTLGLAALTGQSVRIDNIRANRGKTGLLRQHLTAFRAVAEICDADIEGASLGSSTLTFRPRKVKGGKYHFAISTAGSTNLVFQTVLWPLLFADEGSTVIFEGGTHNDKSPPFDFIERTFLPLLRRMGGDVTAHLERHGFHPAGGGRFVVHIAPCNKLQPLDLIEAGDVTRIIARALRSRVPDHVTARELNVVREELGLSDDDCFDEKVKSPGPGNVVVIHVERPTVTETVTAFGAKKVRAEAVARRAVAEVRAYLDAGVPVGEHLADQLLIPMSLAGGGSYRTLRPSLHTTTNIGVVATLLGRGKAGVADDPEGGVRVVVV